MGKRKLRLSVRKNYERRKYQKHLKLIVSLPLNLYCTTDLIVQIPRTIYLSATATNSCVLYTRIMKLSTTIKWSVTFAEETSVIILKKLYCSFTLTVTIAPDCSWSVTVGDHLIELKVILAFNQERVDNVNSLLKLLENIDKSDLCVGNPDVKFDKMRERREGKFFNQLGKLHVYLFILIPLKQIGEVIAYYDSRMLPVPTICHSACATFVMKNTERCKACDDYR